VEVGEDNIPTPGKLPGVLCFQFCLCILTLSQTSRYDIMPAAPILVNDSWIASSSKTTFPSINPKTTSPLPGEYPVSGWADIEPALVAAERAFVQLQQLPVAEPTIMMMYG
jgi:hypothetical protein